MRKPRETLIEPNTVGVTVGVSPSLLTFTGEKMAIFSHGGGGTRGRRDEGEGIE